VSTQESDFEIAGKRVTGLVFAKEDPNLFVTNSRTDVVHVEVRKCATDEAVVKRELPPDTYLGARLEPGAYSLAMGPSGHEQLGKTIRIVMMESELKSVTPPTPIEFHAYYALRKPSSLVPKSSVPNVDNLGSGSQGQGQTRDLLREFFNPSRPQPSEERAALPPIEKPLTGRNEIRVTNPHDYSVDVQIRTGAFASNFSVAPHGTGLTHGPDGSYQIFFIYSNEPDALYQGDDFNLNHQRIEIQLVNVSDGNYHVRKIK